VSGIFGKGAFHQYVETHNQDVLLQLGNPADGKAALKASQNCQTKLLLVGQLERGEHSKGQMNDVLSCWECQEAVS